MNGWPTLEYTFSGRWANLPDSQGFMMSGRSQCCDVDFFAVPRQDQLLKRIQGKQKTTRVT